MECKKEFTEEDKAEKGPDNEIRVNNVTFIRSYLDNIAKLFEDKHEEVVIKAMGYPIPKAVSLALLVRRRFKGLHQIVEIGTVEFDEPERVRKVGLVTLTLSKKELDKTNIGYSAPIPDSEVVEYKPFVPDAPRDGETADPREGREPGERRGGFRGGRRGSFRGRRSDFGDEEADYGASRRGGFIARRRGGYSEEAESGEGRGGFIPRRSGYRPRRCFKAMKPNSVKEEVTTVHQEEVANSSITEHSSNV